MFEGIRSDDIYLLIQNLFTNPGEKLKLEGAGQIALGSVLICLSLVVNVLLAFLTYALGGVVAGLLVGPAKPADTLRD